MDEEAPAPAHVQVEQPLAVDVSGEVVARRKPKPRKKRKALRKLGAFLSIFLAAVILFLAGNLVAHLGLFNLGRLVGLSNPQAQSLAEPTSEVSTEQLAARLSEVSVYLDRESLYRYTQGDLDETTEIAIETLIAQSDDPYATYYNPAEYAEYRRASEGEYSGIGVVLTTRDGEVTVMQVYEGSPAFEAGVKAGDVLLAIDGQRREWTTEEVIETIRRPIGDEVSLLWRRGEQERETLLVLRAVNIPTIVSHLIEQQGDTVGYVHLRRFNNQSASQLREVLTQLEEQGAQAFILDLRGNPGGYLKQAIDITSLFVEKGDVVKIEDRTGLRTEKVAGGRCTDKPLVVLINADSASASELVSAALQDHGRATIVGELSYGKGTVQDVRELSWGAAIKFTIAHYLSPNGAKLDGVGVTPDIEVALGQAGEDFGFADSLMSSEYRYTPGKDAQLDAALEALGSAAAKD